MSTYDVVVGGAGINGLVAAGYMAKAGLNVCVLEYQDYVGGGCWSEKDPVVPGVVHDPCATIHALIQYNPLIVNDELGLKSKYGLKYLCAEGAAATVYNEKGYGLVLWKDLDRCLKEIAEKISPREADNYKKFYDTMLPFASIISQGLFSPLPPVAVQMSLMDSLGDLGKEMMRLLLMSSWDIACEFFESDEMRELLPRITSESMISPFERGTGAIMLLITNMLHDTGFPIAEGGSQKLSDALAQCIRDNGGTIRTGVTVKKIKIVGGEAKAFVLADGEEIEGSKALFTTFHIRQIFGENGMVNGSLFSDDIKRRVKNLRASDYMAMNQHIVLKEAPRYKVFDNQYSPSFGVEQSHGITEFKRFFGVLNENQPSPANTAMGLCSTTVDSTRAPNGEHTLYLYSYEPYDLYGDAKNWEKYGQEIADQKLEAFREIATNMGDDNILNRYFHTPLDYEQTKPSWIKGDFCHFAQSMDQSQSNRPFFSMSHYRTPFEKLYIGGCSTFPGPTITGGGRAQVQVIFEDLGIDFDDVITK